MAFLSPLMPSYLNRETKSRSRKEATKNGLQISDKASTSDLGISTERRCDNGENVWLGCEDDGRSTWW